MRLGFSVTLSTLALLAAACAGDSRPAPFDRGEFDLVGCPDATTPPFNGLSPADPVDGMALLGGFGGGSTVTLCGGATDMDACQTAVSELLPPPDPWQESPSGGAAAPSVYIVYTRGDEVGAIGRSELPAFLGELSEIDAAYLAQIATLGSVACDETSVRRVEGGHEVLTTTTFPCGGRTEEHIVFVSDTGETTIIDTVVTRAGTEELCP